MIVRFTRRCRILGERVMDAVPRSGESVTLDGQEYLVVWNVAWVLAEGEQAAVVELKTRREYMRELGGRPRERKADDGALAT